jgi:hypothetical protein
MVLPIAEKDLPGVRGWRDGPTFRLNIMESVLLASEPGEVSTTNTNDLLTSIKALVSRSKDGIAIESIARQLRIAPHTIAHCIGLHLYLECRQVSGLAILLRSDDWVPRPTDVITDATLDPRGN